MAASASASASDQPAVLEQARSPADVIKKCIMKVIELEKAVQCERADLQNLLSLLSSDVHEQRFNSFCKDLSEHICKSMSTVKVLQPQHARERALSEFHALRLNMLPDIWKKLATDLECTSVNTLQQQSVNREVFNSYFIEQYGSAKEFEPCRNTSLSAEEDNAIRYVSGYIVSKLMDKYRKECGDKAAQFFECLSSMGNIVHDTAALEFTSQGVRSIDRGGLLHVNDSTFQLFRAVEVRIQKLLPQHLIKQTSDKSTLVKSVMDDEDVQFQWCMISADVATEEDSLTLLKDIIELCITTRGFAVTAMWLEEYKKAQDKNVKKSKSLREELKK